MASIITLLHQLIGYDLGAATVIILNIILVESLLSVDNAAVLATMVMHLPKAERIRALRIGLVLAYVFRGSCLLLAGWLIKITWLKFLGGLYLLYLCLHFFYQRIFQQQNILQQEDVVEPTIEQNNTAQRWKFLSPFWSTVLMVEIMDITFSIDNVFAAVAITDNLYLVCVGVFIGIVSMRIVAGYFVKLMARFPFLDVAAFGVIGLLGLKLVLSFLGEVYFPALHHLLDSERSDLYFSLVTMVVFVLPILIAFIFGMPKEKQ